APAGARGGGLRRVAPPVLGARRHAGGGSAPLLLAVPGARSTRDEPARVGFLSAHPAAALQPLPRPRAQERAAAPLLQRVRAPARARPAPRHLRARAAARGARVARVVRVDRLRLQPGVDPRGALALLRARGGRAARPLGG